VSFSENPIIDKYSKASEESVHNVKGVFSQKNGFISREEYPDFGADLDVELISKESGASGRKFAIQIKSSDDFTYLEKGDFISFPFKTSRLGYLCRRMPGHGLVILYDTNKKVSYFDYVEEIYNRLIDDRENDAWKEQENVNIHIPTSNVLNQSSVIGIHKRIENKFNQIETALGHEILGFKVPLLKKEEEDKIDFTDPIQISEALKKYGLLLVNTFEYDILYKMISSIPIAQITSSKELLYLSAFTYSGVGKLFDADFFIKKCFNRLKEYSSDEINTLKLLKIKNDLAFGRYDNETYLEKLQELKNSVEEVANSLIIEMSILNSKITSLYTGKLQLSAEIEKELLDFYEIIENSNVDERLKHLLKIYHSENISGYSQKLFGESTTLLKVREEIGVDTPMDERVDQAKNIIRISNLPYKYFQEAIDYANKNDDELLYAYTLFSASGHFLRHHFGFAALNRFESESDLKEAINIYEHNTRNSLKAFNKLYELGRFKDALLSLHNALELMKLFKYQYKQELSVIDSEEIKTRINKLSNELDIEPFESIVDSAYEHIINYKDDWSNIKDGEEIEFAKTFAEAANLSEDRIPNIVSDIKAYKIFEARCDNPNLELLQDLRHTISQSTMYATKPSYILRDKSTQFQSQPTSDISKLLDEYEHLLKKTNSS